ncbi:hypothetical protein SKAU_G00017270 [Synaphobranchus kaupii]|uniref:Uncharacterized protein n=1 Tax=Synaphobranchus kaupii TaxID=118154 RepID=A0A9Q1GCF1_SYNKA|nr:hypothetical protein SKAU_G00017270 [Synaphobranchus kaupii]
MYAIATRSWIEGAAYLQFDACAFFAAIVDRTNGRHIPTVLGPLRASQGCIHGRTAECSRQMDMLCLKHRGGAAACRTFKSAEFVKH